MPATVFLGRSGVDLEPVDRFCFLTPLLPDAGQAGDEFVSFASRRLASFRIIRT